MPTAQTETHSLWSLELFKKDVPLNIEYLLNSEVLIQSS